jgi:potassium channel
MHMLQAVVAALLTAGANPNASDNLGGCALLEAVKGNHMGVLAALRAAGSTLQLSGEELSSILCSLAKAGGQQDAELLRRYIDAGADMSAADYDGRTALHIAAAEGSLPMVQLLVAEGGASLNATDRWGATPLAEARRVGAAAVVTYLGSTDAKQAAAALLAARRGHDGSGS